jgi:hypothetical protein
MLCICAFRGSPHLILPRQKRTPRLVPGTPWPLLSFTCIGKGSDKSPRVVYRLPHVTLAILNQDPLASQRVHLVGA